MAEGEFLMRMFKNGARAVAAVGCAVALVGAFGPAAHADGPGVKDVVVFVETAPDSTKVPYVSPGGQRSTTDYPSGYNEITACPSGGSCNKVTTQFSSTKINDCGFWTCTRDISGQSHGYWQGTSPWNADDMTLGDKWNQNGCSVSVSYPAGVGITGSGDTAQWDTQSGVATWQMHHYFNGIRFTTYSCFTSFWEYSTTTARFGSTWYSTTATW